MEFSLKGELTIHEMRDLNYQLLGSLANKAIGKEEKMSVSIDEKIEKADKTGVQEVQEEIRQQM